MGIGRATVAAAPARAPALSVGFGLVAAGAPGALELVKAGCVLERSEPAGSARDAAAAETAESGNRARGSNRPAQGEGAQRRPSPPLAFLHATIVRMRLASLGDLILDVVVQLEAPLVPGDDRPATTRVGAGGQA